MDTDVWKQTGESRATVTRGKSPGKERRMYRPFVIREKVEVAPPVMWGQERDLNMPPAEWFRGVWYAEQKRREVEAMEEARRRRMENIVENVCYALMVAGMVALFVYGCVFIG